jgi:hypothetical protein
MNDADLPLDYLATCSKPSLEAFELGRLNRAANLRKELRDILEAWIQAEGEARLARWLLEGRRAQDSEIHVSGRESALRPEPAVQVPLAFLQGRDGSAEWSMTSGTAVLDDGNKSCDRVREVATGSIPILPARPEMQEADKPDSAKASVRKAAGLAQLRPTGATVASGVPAAFQPIGRLADAGEQRPPRLSSVGAVGDQPDACGQSCNLHPAIQLTLLPRRVGDDPLGEAAHAPAVEPSVSLHLLKAAARQETQAPVQFRIRFGRPAAPAGEMAAAS